MEYKVLDLGLVYYKNVIPEPDKLINLIESVDERLTNNEHANDNKTTARGWSPWSYGDMIFNYQKFFPESKDISDEDYYAKEMKEIADVLYPSLNTALHHYTHEVYPFAAKNIKSREQTIHLLSLIHI